jgi:hypothetical protein
MGPEGIFYGDKVINVGNHRRFRVYPKESKDGKKPLMYVANGEIGIVTGPFQKKGSKINLNCLAVTFSTQAGFEYTFWPGDLQDDGSLLELAYALTVHKAQGSEFKTVFVVIPNPCRLLSRELLYTALTRQRGKLVLLCQGNPRELFAYRHHSDTARRLTNLFLAPDPIQVGFRSYDGKHIHRSKRGELMISKSELVIANELHSTKISYDYERPFVGEDGSVRYPDFTIEDSESGVTWYWEHLGMLNDENYRNRWKRKLEWYRTNGVLPVKDGGGPKGTLLTTSENNGFDMKQVLAAIELIKKG